MILYGLVGRLLLLHLITQDPKSNMNAYFEFLVKKGFTFNSACASMATQRQQIVMKKIQKHNSLCLFFLFGALSLTLLLISIILFTLFLSPSPSSAAESSHSQVNLEVAEVLSISTDAHPTNGLVMSVTPSNTGSFVKQPLKVTVDTNNATGYTLNLNTKTADTNLVHADPSLAPAYLIPTLSTDVSINSLSSPTNFPLNRWGYSVVAGPTTADQTLFKPIPSTTATPPANTIRTTSAPGSTDTDLLFGSYVDMTLAAGRYQNTLVFTAVANYVPRPESFKFTMEFGSEIFLFPIILPLHGLVNAVPDPSSYMNYLNAKHPYDWIIDWGDGSTPEHVFGTSDALDFNSRLTHRSSLTPDLSDPDWYDRRYQLQITITSAGNATDGWLNAFGSGNVDNLFDATAGNIKSIDTPLTTLMRTRNSSFRYAYMFANQLNLEIPANLFSHVDTSRDTNLSSMFEGTFANNTMLSNYGANANDKIPSNLFGPIDTSHAVDLSNLFKNTFSYFAPFSSTVTIPSGIFNSISTTSATDLSGMFYGTFSSFGASNPSLTLPSNLFDSINTNGITNLSSLFERTFFNMGRDSTILTIPVNLFRAIDTSSATNLSNMFASTFNSFAYGNTTDTIPAGLLDTIDTSRAETLSGMFNGTFSSFAVRNNTTTLPSRLFSFIDTSNATDLSYLFYQTFFDYGSKANVPVFIPSDLFADIDISRVSNLTGTLERTFYRAVFDNPSGGAIGSNLFDFIDLSSATSLDRFFAYTFAEFAGIGHVAPGPSRPETDINDLWGNANFADKITPSNAGGTDGVFYSTFFAMTELVGVAQNFVSSKLDGIAPAVNSRTFYASRVDGTGLAPTWK